jgi:hypothetical protein
MRSLETRKEVLGRATASPMAIARLSGRCSAMNPIVAGPVLRRFGGRPVMTARRAMKRQRLRVLRVFHSECLAGGFVAMRADDACGCFHAENRSDDNEGCTGAAIPTTGMRTRKSRAKTRFCAEPGRPRSQRVVVLTSGRRFIGTDLLERLQSGRDRRIQRRVGVVHSRSAPSLEAHSASRPRSPRPCRTESFA